MKSKNKYRNMDNCYDENKELSILRSAIENTNEAFVTIDEDHKVLFFNKAAEEIFGYSRDEVIGHDLYIIMAPECSRDHHQAVKRYLTTRDPIRIGHETELIATRKNGETFPANISVTNFTAFSSPHATAVCGGSGGSGGIFWGKLTSATFLLH